MMIRIRNITFTLHRTNGAVDSFTKEIAGDDEMVQWANKQFAEVNECGCTAQCNGQEIAAHGMSNKPVGYTYAISTRKPKQAFVFCKWFTTVQLAIDYAIGEVNDRSQYDVEYILIREGTNNADDPIIWDSRKHMPMQFAAEGQPLVEPMDPQQIYKCDSGCRDQLVVYPGEIEPGHPPVVAFVCEGMTGQSDNKASALLTHDDVRRLRNQLNQLLGE